MKLIELIEAKQQLKNEVTRYEEFRNNFTGGYAEFSLCWHINNDNDPQLYVDKAQDRKFIFTFRQAVALRDFLNKTLED